MSATETEPALFPRFLREVEQLKANLTRLADEKAALEQELATTRKAALVWQSRVADFERAEVGEPVLGVDAEAWLTRHQVTLKWMVSGRGREVYVLVRKRILARAPRVKDAVAQARRVLNSRGTVA